MSPGAFSPLRARAYTTFWAVAVVAFVTDVLTKLHIERIFPLRFENDWVYHFSENPERSPIAIFPWLWIVHVGNKGAAWGLGRSMTFARSSSSWHWWSWPWCGVGATP